MSSCFWPIGNGNNLKFEIYNLNENWNKLAGLYIFAYNTHKEKWVALYVGQTDDFSSRLPNHERLYEAIQRGATHIHALVVPQTDMRDEYEKLLIKNLQPSMNVLLKKYGS